MERVISALNVFLTEIIIYATEVGVNTAIEKFKKENLLPSYSVPEKEYDLKEVLSLYLKDDRFKKISPGALKLWEDRGIITNYGTPRHKKYKETELVEAMKNKGKRRLAQVHYTT